jgi:uncharacterized DUF497 family protein
MATLRCQMLEELKNDDMILASGYGSAYGQTEAGRYIIVFFVLKRGRQALVISARDMDGKERKTYGRR